MKELMIDSHNASQRMDKYLKRVFPNMGTSFLYKMLRKKNITLNGKKATGSELIQTGDLIQCFFSDETFDKFAGNNSLEKKIDAEKNEDNTFSSSFIEEYRKAYNALQNIQVIYEDEHILLLDKPAGVLSQKAAPEDVSLNEWMIGYLLDSRTVTEDSLRHFKPSVCNRLDRNTSGLVICGKTLIGSREMSRILKNRSLQKYYHTYVHGNLKSKKVLEGYHHKNKSTNQAKILFEKPKQNAEQYDAIITAYHSLESKKNYSYLEIELITGKTHQIRAHLAAYGHPIAGDKKYGKEKAVNNMNYPKNQLLHAYRIVFPSLEGELTYLSNKEFICEEPISFQRFRDNFFL